MAERPLTDQQERRLVIAAGFGVTQSIKGSMPSLARRGLMERYRFTEAGRSFAGWRVTEAGVAEVTRIQAARNAAKQAAGEGTE
jgi:hypothetical protein